MSKRFGRNRKRKMQAALAAAEQQAARGARAEREARQLQEAVERAFGRHSALLPPNTVNGGREDDGRDEWHMHRQADYWRLRAPGDPYQPIPYTTERLHRLSAHAEWDGSVPGYHIRVRFGSLRVGYFLSADAFCFSERSTVCAHLAREIEAALRKAGAPA